ncbi:APC family permease [Catenulispora sp. NF23]|uniref:APC family permease n=1 Tax=Catenulispora pinistramenti TaxID=2705254 RepID=A0ABS5KTN5_9ACTN|nr:APC family permease [Catenulispora pinistramenti]MBS2537909.1 APC family permease [Catenulispora pinistramenti]MBS2549360.1 APC family permease [Catenulispora pinistramenti]
MAVLDATPGAPDSHSTNLRREVGLIGLLWASEGSIIGSGWLYSAQKALVAAGPAALISWGIAAVAIIALAFVHAELGGMFPVAGGTARYPHYAFGGAAGASFGWFTWLQAVTVPPIEVQAMIGYAQHYTWADSWQHKDGTLTGYGELVAILLMAVFTAVNFLGIQKLAAVNNAATWWKIGVPLFTIFVLAFTNFHGSNFTAESGGGFMPFGAHGIMSAVSTSGIIFALLGFEQAIQLAGESRNPKRDIPRATILSILIGAAIYIMLQVVYIAALPAATFAAGWAHLDYKNISGPFAGLATLVGLAWLATILYIDAIISPGGTGLIYTTSTSRITYGLSKNGYIPVQYEYLTKRGVPWLGMITAFVAACICFLPFPSWQQLVSFITSASVLMYAGAPLAFGVFREKLPDVERPYRLAAGAVLAPFAFIVANLIILWAGWDTDWRLGIAIVIGYVLLAISRIFHLNPNHPPLELRSAQWLLPYLVVMGIIVRTSAFGPMKDPWFTEWTSLAAVAVVSLVVYYWAKAVALPVERIEAHVAGVAVLDAGGH